MLKTRVISSNMKDKISIAIATYNGARFLREQLDSLYTQTLLPDEVVVCDDASTDGTVDILEEYHKQYGLKYYVNETGLGCNQNFIKAFSLCQGDFVCICDQDDIWLPNKIETVYHKICSLDNTKPQCVSSLRYDIDANGNIIGEVNAPDSQGWEATFLTYSRSQGCTMIMNRLLTDLVVSLVEAKPDLMQQMYYDELVAYTAVVKGEKHNLSDKLMYYRHHDANVVGKYHGSLSFADKVRNVPTFYGFMIDERMIPISITYHLFNEQIKEPALHAFLNDIAQTMEQPTVWKKLRRLLRSDFLSRKQRMEIAVKSTISIILKKLYHCPTL